MDILWLLTDDGGQKDPLCITVNENILASGNFCFRVFKLQLKVINKTFSYLSSVWVNQFNTFTAKEFSETRPFMHLSKRVFGSQ